MSPRNSQMPLTHCEQLRLLERLRARDREAQSELVRRYHETLLQRTTDLVRDPALAEDAVQDTWLVVLERVDRFEGRSSLLTWLTGIALNRARDHRRRSARAVPLSSLPERPESSDAAAPASKEQSKEPASEITAERVVLERERRRALDVAVEALPDTQRSVVLLQLKGCNPAETRETLRITDLARRVRLSRARSRLRNDLRAFAA